MTNLTAASIDFQHAADLALFGHIAVPPKVDPSRCEAALVRFSSPFYDVDGEVAYTEALAVITRGAQGAYRSTTGVYAMVDGALVEDDERWKALIDPTPLVEDSTLQQVVELLRGEGAVIGDLTRL